jgi:hypothetical protein
MSPTHLTRRAALGAGYGLVLVACRPSEDRSRPVPTSRAPQEDTIFDLSFSIESRYRPFTLIGTQAGTDDAPAGDGIRTASEAPPAPFCAIEAEVAGASGRVVLGLADGDDDHLLGWYDVGGGAVGIDVRVGGTTTTVQQRDVDLPTSVRLAVAVCENKVTVLADTGEGWQPLLTERDEVRALVDMRRPETLARHRYSYGTSGGDDARLSSVRWGLFGMTGIRDQHLVQHSDGTPYVQDGKAYFTATCAGLGFFQQAHWGVFTLDLDRPERLEQVAQLYFRRDGLLLGDHAGQVVRDDEAGRWIVATSSWGDFDFDGVHVRHVETTDDVLHGVHVLETTRTPLPTQVSSWDPGLTKIDGRWHVGFVESPSQDPFDFHPALAVAEPGQAWHHGLELVGVGEGFRECEGPILAEVGGQWWFLASDGVRREYPVFDLQMRRAGSLDAPYETNIPHPQLVPLADGSHLLVTFDGTQYHEDLLGYGGHGDVLIMRSRT